MVLTKSEIIKLLSNKPPLIENFVNINVQLQPAGIDLTVSEIYEFESIGQLDFDNKERKLSRLKQLNFDNNGWIHLKPGVYLVRFNEVINVPLNMIAIGRPRSSLLRMGAFMVSAIWDPGYRGRSVSLLVVLNPHGIKIKKNARVMQLIFIKLTGKTEAYSGKYQFEGLKEST